MAMPKLLQLLIVLLLANSSALASPATDLFERTLALLERYYFGYQPLDSAALRAKFAPKLENLCQGQRECAFATASPLVDEIMTALGDGHSFRYSRERWQGFINDSQGQLAAVTRFGITLAALPDAPALVIKRVVAASGADQAGLRPGDVIVSWGNTLLSDFKNSTEAIAAIETLEKSGQSAVLAIKRQGQSLSLAVTPSQLAPYGPQIESRKSNDHDEIGQITVFQYLSPQVGQQHHDLVRQLQRQGKRGLIFDLRDSRGGSLYNCLSAAGIFLDEIQVDMLGKNDKQASSFIWREQRIFWRDDQGKLNPYAYIKDPVRWDGPVVVLVNGATRSCAEYFAYFLQRAGRATILGSPTAGVLDTATTLSELPDGTALAVTSSRSLDKTGKAQPTRVTPDVMVADDLALLAQGRDVVLEQAVMLLTNQLKR
jgi:carboxyl-terminal processing protease